MKICFVILHYLTDDDTIECINSILKMKHLENVNIVVIDNASNNGSIEKVIKYFNNKNNIYFIKNKSNLGFAKGNNKGYEFAKNKLKSDMIIISNNDVIFNDELFISKLKTSFEKNKFHILGPDIVSLVDKKHQNPIGEDMLTRREAFIEEIRYSILYLLSKINIYNYIIKLKKIQKNTCIVEKTINSGENLILHGACMVFSKLYIDKMNYAFYPETFLYMEEMILAKICKYNKFKMYYDSEIKVSHKEDSSTNKKTSNLKEKREFIFRNMILSLRVYRKVLAKYNLTNYS